MIEVERLTKRYGDFTAIDDISFRVGKGEILGFLGPNGAGKTTTMRIITGFMPPTRGTAKVAGFDVVKKPLEVKRRIGYMPEVPPLYVDMTVNEYLGFAARLKQIPSREIGQKIEDVSAKVGIVDVKEKTIKTLSKGYKQRVGLAQALIHDPEVLILDEPTIGLDPIQIREVRELIRSLAGEHTVILSTHILPEASMICSRVLIIDRGKIVAQDTPEGLAKSLKGAEKLKVSVEGTLSDVSEALLSTKGVKKVLDSSSENGMSKFTLECDFQFPVRRSLSQLFSEKGWNLLEMRVEESTLEDVFLRLTSDAEEGGEL
ncbi:MAG: ABC transporter ATP-binding protein [Candidatus Neomarinimicrobiota bacterium]